MSSLPSSSTVSSTSDWQNLASVRLPGNEHAPAAFGLDRRARLVGVALLFRQIVDRDVGAFAREQHGDRAADAGIAAGDQRDLVLELARGLVRVRLVARTRIEPGLEARRLLVLLRKRRLRLLVRKRLFARFRIHGASFRLDSNPTAPHADPALGRSPNTTSDKIAWTPNSAPGTPESNRRFPTRSCRSPRCTASEHARTPLRDVREIADLTGLPLRDIVAFRPERLALHELLVRVTADISVPDGTRIEDLGINFRRITSTMLERDLLPRMDAIRTAYTRAREAIDETVSRELDRLYAPPPAPVRARRMARAAAWIARDRNAAPMSERELIAEWETRAREAEGAERAALRALSRLVSALVVRHERVWADRGLVARVASDMAANEWGSAAIGAAIEPMIADAVEREGYRVLRRQDRPVVMNTKGPSAAGKSTMRPLQKQLAGRIGVDWAEFALISPDIWRKQLLDYGSLGDAYKYAGAFTGDELAIVDQKLDRYMARKAQRGEMSHLLIDRFRFDSFAPHSEEAGSNLLTRFGEIVYLFFLVTPPAALVERAWNRGLDVGRYKAVDDTLAHSVEAYSGMPELFFTWIRRADKRVHFEFLDNTVTRGAPPRTAAFGWNEVMNILDVDCLIDIERYQKIDVDAQATAVAVSRLGGSRDSTQCRIPAALPARVSGSQFQRAVDGKGLPARRARGRHVRRYAAGCGEGRPGHSAGGNVLREERRTTLSRRRRERAHRRRLAGRLRSRYLTWLPMTPPTAAPQTVPATLPSVTAAQPLRPDPRR